MDESFMSLNLASPFPSPPIPYFHMTVEDFKKKSLPLLAPEDFYVLLAHVSGKSREFLLAHPEYALDTETEARVRESFARRLAREPVAYITGEKEFFGLPFRVTRDTLIPRPETEMLVERAIEEVRCMIIEESDPEYKKNILIADIGTGSGAIIISLASEIKKQIANGELRMTNCELHAVDISSNALAIARGNAERNGVPDMITFHEGNLIDPITKYFKDADKIILIANLPYLSETIYASADDDVTAYEPKSALLSGGDGLDHYRELFASIKENILPFPSYHLSALCEISPEQDTLIAEVFAKAFPKESSQVFPDLSGRSRVFSFRLGKPRP